MFNPALYSFFLLFVCVGGHAIDGTGLQMSIAGDMTYFQGINKDSTAGEKMTMRGAEMVFYAPVDHNFNGNLSVAAHDEGGRTFFEIHEMFISSSKIIGRTQFKVGRFFLGIGRLNQIHQHDWPFIQAPKVHETFFGSEGVFDDGVQMSHLLPLGGRYLNFIWGVTSGYRYGHSHTVGSRPRVPLHYFKMDFFQNFSNIDGLLVGLNYLGRTDGIGNKNRITGLDVTAKWKKGKKLQYMLQSEIWHRYQKNFSNVKNEQAGLYIFNQSSISDSLLLGFRLDAYRDFSKRNALTNKKINNIEYGFTPELSWKSSEFTTIKTGVSHIFTREEGRTIEKDMRFALQFVFIMGSHPAHDF
ncbi:MAG: TonB-dependent receptor [Halobacteriovoraceae bacterium]|nr:TonB-dependent receptor [Halobacteriovoraceae bacterium]